MAEDKKERRPSWERRRIKEIMKEQGVKHTQALRIFEKEKVSEGESEGE